MQRPLTQNGDTGFHPFFFTKPILPMRLASFLPMLLLAFSIPVAAQNCNIFDLTATVVQFNPNNCQFFVSLDFQHNGTTNQFTVSGNGTNYGLFPYGQLPLLLGPFNANPNAPTQLEFIVNDAIIPGCTDQAVIVVPPCVNGPCDITDLNVLPGLCNPIGQSYSLLVNFNVQVQPLATFEVWANGNSIGTFPLGALPLLIPAFPASGNPTDEIRVCITGFQNCCEILVFDAPNCAPPPCGIENLIVQAGACTSDSTYKAIIDFDVVNPAPLDSFALWSNGQLVGMYGINQLPLTANIAWDGGITDEIKVCIASAGVTCCKTRAYPVPACLGLPPCAILDLVVKPDTCTSDSTFLAVLNFTVNDPNAVDSFDLWANGEFLGHYGMNQLPLQISNFHWNGLIFNHVKVCTGNLPACCKEYQFLAPSCLPFKPCEVTNISVQTGLCTSDSTYNATINFNATNPGIGQFVLWSNGILVDTFNLTEAPIMLNVLWNGGAFDDVKICILESPNFPGSNCCKSIEYHVPNCILPCDIFDVSVEVGDCNPNSNTYNLSLKFGATNPGNDFFEVWGNGTYLGLFALDSLPLLIPNFPSNGNATDVIKICINDQPNCCETFEFQGPDCNPNCEIFDVVVDPGDCIPGTNGYNLFLNFQVNNPGNDFFEVWGNGTYLGLFALDSLPLVIPNFPSNGNPMDIIKICINDHPDCCKIIDFQGPDCIQNCEIFDVVVDPGACNPTSNTYSLTLNFQVQNPGNALFEVWGNGVPLGMYPLNALPLVIPNFPSNGNAIDVIKICIVNNTDCCKAIDFQGPDCSNPPCEIFNLSVVTGDCHPADSTYDVTVNFQVQNPSSNIFGLWANGQFLGNYNLSQLPLQLNNVPWDGNGPNDVIKVCLVTNNGTLSCCRSIEFPAPDCYPDNCAVNDLQVEIGNCTGDSTYNVVVNFQVQNPPSNVFSLWANGQFFGIFNLNQLPLSIQDFPWNGGNFDHIKVCFTNAPQGACCAEIEFHVPDCLFSGPCEIFNLTVTPGDCNPNAPTYPLTFDFDVVNPGNAFFEVWVNGVYFGAHPLTALPFTIPNVPSNGVAGDVIKVCINDHPDCCKIIDFAGPNCNGGGGNCEIFNVMLTPGPCDPATTNYKLTLDFDVVNPDNDFFEVWGNGVYLGMFPLANLPLMIPNFPSNGNAIDVIKICIANHPDCCKIIEFQGPNCNGQGNCEIFDFGIETGDCTGDSTYQLRIKFQVINPPSDLFQVWANGQLFGVFNLNQLPLQIQNFPWNGGNNDVVKVCMVTNVPNSIPCCFEREYAVPACLGNGDCHIWDLQVLRTPCLCGQFFAVLTFNHENGGAGGFDIFGNGNNYGNFAYDTTQPIILGPFNGDGTTMYGFEVVDHNHPNNCFDEAMLGKVDCMTPVVTPTVGSAFLTLSPNPTANWLNVTALLENGAALGQSNVEVFASDGRLALTNTVANGANFQLDVSNLPSGVYRIVLKSDSGRLEGTFAKQ